MPPTTFRCQVILPSHIAKSLDPFLVQFLVYINSLFFLRPSSFGGIGPASLCVSTPHNLRSMEASNVASSVLISSVLKSCIPARIARNDATQGRSDPSASASPRSASAPGKQGPDVSSDKHVALHALTSRRIPDLSTSETFTEEPLAAVSLTIPPFLTEEKLGHESDE